MQDTLPEDLRNRRDTRGIHGVSVSPDGKTAYAIMRVPLGKKKVHNPVHDGGLCSALAISDVCFLI